MAGLRTVKIRITGESKGLDAAAKKSTQSMSKWQRGMQAANKVGNALLGVGGAVAGAVVKTAAAADRIGTQAPKLGLTTDAYQEMSYWAEQNGLSASSFDRAVGRLNQRIGKAVGGNKKYSEAFKGVGVSLKDAHGKIRSTSDVMGETIQKLSQIKNPAEQSAKASEIFGTKMARDLMPALQDGALSLDDAKKKAHSLGLVMSGDTIDSATKFQEALDQLKTAGTGIITQFATPFLKAFSTQVVPVLETKVLPVIKKVTDALHKHPEAVKRIIAVLVGAGGLLKTFSIVSKGMSALAATNPWVLIIAGVVLLVTLIVTHWDQIKKAIGAAWDWISAKTSAVWNWIKKAVGVAVNFLVQLFLNFTGPGLIIKHWDTIKKATGAVWDWIKKAVKTVINFLVTLFLNFTGPGLIIKHWDTIKSATGKVWDWIKNAVKTAVNFLVSLFKRFTLPGIIMSHWNTIKSGTSRVWNGILSFIKGVPGKIKGFFSGLGNTLLSPFRAAFNGIRNLWNNTLGGKGFTAPSWVPGIGGKGFTIPYLAKGGTIARGGLAVVGERGPELLSLSRGAQVTPLDRSEATAGRTAPLIGAVYTTTADPDRIAYQLDWIMRGAAT